MASRFFIGVLLSFGWLVYAASVCAQTAASAPVHGVKLEHGNFDVLLNVRLPDEPQQIAEGNSTGIENLLGKQIVSFEAVDPPAGFSPVADLGMQPGMMLTRGLARQMVMRLWECGKYRDIQIFGERTGPSGVTVRIRVEPMFRMSKLVLSGNEALNEADIKRAIGFFPGATIVPTSAAMVAIRDRLLAEYGRRGYKNATASVRLETTAAVSELALLVDIVEGAPDKYTEVNIFGLPADLEKEKLLRVSGLKRGIVRDEDSVREGLKKLETALFELGYPDVRIPDEYTEKKIGHHLFSLNIRAEGGLKTNLEFFGNQRIRSRDLHSLLWQQGLRSDVHGVEKAMAQITQYAVSKGLFHATVKAARRCYANPDKWYTVDYQIPCTRKEVSYQSLLFHLDEGPPVEMADVIIDGARHFSISYLKDEIFAYMAEQNRSDDVFEEFSTTTLDNISSVDNSGTERGRSAGTKTVYSQPGAIYNPEKYLNVTSHLEDLYAEQGYLRAEVTDTCVIAERSPLLRKERKFFPLVYQRDETKRNLLTPCLYISEDKTQLIATITVSEGVQTLIEGISVSGNSPGLFTTPVLLELGGLTVHQPYNDYFVRDATERIQKAYQEKGYMFVAVTWDTRMSEDRKQAFVEIRIEEGPQVRINNIIINAERTNKWFISDNLGFESGDLVTPSGLTEARQRVMDIGVFNAATVQMQSPGIAAEKKNIIVTVVERKGQYLELRAGAATEEGVRGGFEYGHRNIFGLAISYRLKIRANYRPESVWFFGSDAQEFKDDLVARYARYNAEHDSTLAPTFKWFEWYLLTGFRTNNIPGTSGFLGTGIDVTFENVNRRGFSALKVTPRYRLTSHYLKFLPVEVYTGVDGTIVLPSESGVTGLNTSIYARLPSGRAVFWVTGLAVSLDFRDSPLDPRNGIFLSLKGDYVHSLDKYTERQEEGVIRRSRYIRFEGSLSGYIPFADKTNVLALSTSIGYIFHLIDNSIAWSDRHFYMGGVSTLRGFKSDTLRPQDIPARYDEKGELTMEPGGQAMFLVRAELRHDFGKNIIGVLFGEAGNLWRDETLFLRKKNRQFAPYLLRPTAGLGIHYNTPVGPLAFDVGFNLDRKKELEEALWAWYFSIGSAF